MTILAHHCIDKEYLSILNALDKECKLTITKLHEHIFDYMHLNPVENLLLPIQEYTQEFHSFVESNHLKMNIFLYFGSMRHKQLEEYSSQNNIFTIIKSPEDTENFITFSKLYDNIIFNIKNKTRSKKTLVILSRDNNKNKNIFDNKLYPHQKLSVCLINNPEYKHPQNIGIATQNEIAELLNSYNNLLDIDNEFELEAQACGINNLVYMDSIEHTINHPVYKEQTKDVYLNSAEYFVKTKLLSKMKGK